MYPLYPADMGTLYVFAVWRSIMLILPSGSCVIFIVRTVSLTIVLILEAMLLVVRFNFGECSQLCAGGCFGAEVGW